MGQHRLRVQAKAHSWLLDSLKGKIIFKLTFSKLLKPEDKDELMKKCERAIENIIEDYEFIKNDA